MIKWFTLAINALGIAIAFQYILEFGIFSFEGGMGLIAIIAILTTTAYMFTIYNKGKK